MSLLNVKIVSDGTAAGTKVFNADTGEAIRGVTHVGFEITAGEPALCSLTLVCRPVDVSIACGASVNSPEAAQ